MRKIEQVVAMGFTTPQATYALRRSKGVVATAVEWLIAHPLEHPTDDASMLDKEDDAEEDDEDEAEHVAAGGVVPAPAAGIDPVRFNSHTHTNVNTHSHVIWRCRKDDELDELGDGYVSIHTHMPLRAHFRSH